jgi:plasmid maintenance system antidote protein VapI
MVMRFARAVDVKAGTMLRMQATYDLAQTRARERGILVDRAAA